MASNESAAANPEEGVNDAASGVPTVIFVCETCGYDAENPDAVRPGKRLGESLTRALSRETQAATANDDMQRAAALADLEVHPFRCLMACKRGCSAQVRGVGKIGYTVGDLKPDAASVQTLIDYALLYRVSQTGEVPFKQWPDGVRGKFVARFPVLPPLNQENQEP